VLAPERDLARVAEAHGRLSSALDSLDDEDVARPTLLPGWTVGHVLNHLARNADSHVRRTVAALRGETVEQYPGGRTARAAEIEAGAGRRAAELVEDVRRSAEAVDEAWRDVPTAAWSVRSFDGSGLLRALFELPSRRWQEVWVHLVDLGVGVTHRHWPDDFVTEWLPRTRERMWDRLAPGARTSPPEAPADELAWLYGRLLRPDVPAPPSWG